MLAATAFETTPCGGLWLYPISKGSGYYFFEGSGVETGDTSFESFAAMIERSTDDPQGDLWGIYQNRKRVQFGDEIVVYSCATQTHRPLLVGLGRVVQEAEWVPDWGKYAIRIRWDRPATLALCASPVDATYLKDRLPRQKCGVVTLSPDLQRWVRNGIENAKRKKKLPLKRPV